MSATPLIDQLVDHRLSDPAGFAAKVAARKRPRLDPSEPIMMVAADHPARGALTVAGQANAMADRELLLERCLTALAQPGVNGFLGTPDMIEDLANLGALDNKLVFGSMNRGGLAGAVFEMDDRMTGYDVTGVVDQDLDGGKMLLRFDLNDPATVATMETCAKAVTRLGRARRIAMVEPFISERDANGHVVNDLSTQAIVKSVAMTAGLGASSAWTWLKLPAAPDMAAVAQASSMPILILGGEVSPDPEATRRRWADALAVKSVRGLVLGRSILYPSDGDVERAVTATVKLLGD